MKLNDYWLFLELNDYSYEIAILLFGRDLFPYEEEYTFLSKVRGIDNTSQKKINNFFILFCLTLQPLKRNKK